MNSIDRAEKHHLLDEFLDKEAASERLYNSFETYAAARSAAYQARRNLELALGNDIFVERFMAASIARHPYEIVPEWSAEARAAAAQPAPTNAMLRHHADGDILACDQRRMVAQFLQDHQHELPENVAMNMALTLYALNAGGVEPLARPYRIKGLMLHGATLAKQTASVAAVAKLYYTKGYRDLTLEGVILAESHWFEDFTLAALKKFIARANLRSFADMQEADGKADRIAGLPERCNIAAVHDLDRIAELTAKK